VIRQKIKEMALDLDCAIVNPDNFARFEEYVKIFPRITRPQGHDPAESL